MKLVKLIPALSVVALGAFLATNVSYATPEMTKKEKKPCTTCHVTAKSKELNEVGKYYKEKNTLEGAPAPKK
jgi:hypothetical protein